MEKLKIAICDILWGRMEKSLKESSWDSYQCFCFPLYLSWFSIAVATAAMTAFYETVAATSRYQACAVIVNSRHYRNLEKSHAQ